MNKKLIFLFIIVAALVQFACKKDNNGGGPPTITNIRLIDTTKRDSFFTAATPGTEIVIQGSNLGGVQAIYFNDTAAYFNPVYNTGSNIIVTIPATAQTKATDPNVPSIIKVVTDHGTVTFPFELFLPGPYITSLAFDNTGKVLTITGGNFEGIQKIVFPTANSDTALSYTVNKDFNQIMAVVPPAAALQDSIRVYCTYGVGSFSYPPPMTVTSVSNENGAAGTTITFNGTNFIGINQVTFPGGIVSTAVTPVNVNQFMVTVPTGITMPDYLTASGALGNVTSPLPFDTYITHPSPGYLCTFEGQYNTDNTGFVGWTGGYADQSTATATYHGSTGAVGVLQQASPMPANAGPTSQGNSGILQLSDQPWVSNTAESINGYSLKFELYVASPWSAGELWIEVGDWYTWQDVTVNNVNYKGYAARFAPWESATGGVYQPTGWVTITIPLTQFITGNQFYQTTWNSSGSPASKFSDYATTGLAFMIANDQAKAVPAGSINVAIDNVRIVKGQ